MSKTEKWHQRRLARYFMEHYAQYEETAEFWMDPAPNQWLFDIRELGFRIEITCDDKGNVTETKYDLKRVSRL